MYQVLCLLASYVLYVYIFLMLIRQFWSLILLFIFIVQVANPVGAQLSLPAPGQMMTLSSAFKPLVLKGLRIYPHDPFKFDFILDPGQQIQPRFREQDLLKKESEKLVKYFLASLTIPEEDVWVNLSPYEKDRIIPEAFGQTEMGRDLLAQDYLLKQIMASLLYPEGETGKKFWQKVYALAQEKYGTTDIPVDMFNKVWIVPDKAEVYENAQAGAAYITGSRLKVMLETDYLAEEKNSMKAEAPLSSNGAQDIAMSVLREIVIPVLEQEVNEGRNFARLRQIYQAHILAAWYKIKMRHSFFSMVYVDRNKTLGIHISDPGQVQTIWERYMETFRQGVSLLIREEEDVVSGLMPRKYFSGGASFRINSVMKIGEGEFVSVPGLSAAEGILLEVDMAMQPGVRWMDLATTSRQNGWIMSNEDINYLLAGLDGFGEKGGGYLGIGSFHNLDIALEREADLIVILDIDSKVARVTFELLRLVERSEDFGGLLAAVRRVLVQADPGRFGDGGFETYIKDGYRYGGRTPLLWARDEKQFRTLKALIVSGRVIVAHIDVLDAVAMKQLADSLRPHGMAIRWINLSNLETDISLNDAPLHQKKLLSLPSILLAAGADEQSRIISSIRPGRLEKARQRYGSDLKVLVPARDVAVINSSSFHFAVRTLKVLKETSFWRLSGRVTADATFSSPDVYAPASPAGMVRCSVGLGMLSMTEALVPQFLPAEGGLLLDHSGLTKGGIDLTAVGLNPEIFGADSRMDIYYSPEVLRQAEGAAGFVPVIAAIRVLDVADFFVKLACEQP